MSVVDVRQWYTRTRPVCFHWEGAQVGQLFQTYLATLSLYHQRLVRLIQTFGVDSKVDIKPLVRAGCFDERLEAHGIIAPAGGSYAGFRKLPKAQQLQGELAEGGWLGAFVPAESTRLGKWYAKELRTFNLESRAPYASVLHAAVEELGLRPVVHTPACIMYANGYTNGTTDIWLQIPCPSDQAEKTGTNRELVDRIPGHIEGLHRIGLEAYFERTAQCNAEADACKA